MTYKAWPSVCIDEHHHQIDQINLTNINNTERKVLLTQRYNKMYNNKIDLIN